MKFSDILKPFVILAAEAFKAWNRYHSPEAVKGRLRKKVQKQREEKANIYGQLYKAREKAIKDPLDHESAALAGRLDSKLRKIHKRIEELERRIGV